MCAWLLKITIFLAGWTLSTRWKRKSEERVQKSQLLHLENYTNMGGGNGRRAGAAPGAQQASVPPGKDETPRYLQPCYPRPASPSLSTATTLGFFHVLFFYFFFLSPSSKFHAVFSRALPRKPPPSLPLSASLCKSPFTHCCLGELYRTLAEVKTPCSTIP